ALGRAFDLTTARVRAAMARGGIPGPEGSILKLAIAQLGTRLADVGTTLLGPAGLLLGDGAPEGGRWPEALLGSFAMHIGGGTDEVQRNIVGEVVLGLPREPDPTKDLPFRDLPR
ncbi:MAG TPA: acyl-CoA dehydrogenase family protein, partial [Acidimicrobiales bacterium]|nr:acyl-CoA dehydrogenase family protein [Acidimicrobiales bacterium]